MTSNNTQRDFILLQSINEKIHFPNKGKDSDITLCNKETYTMIEERCMYAGRPCYGTGYPAWTQIVLKPGESKQLNKTHICKTCLKQFTALHRKHLENSFRDYKKSLARSI